MLGDSPGCVGVQGARGGTVPWLPKPPTTTTPSAPGELGHKGPIPAEKNKTPKNPKENTSEGLSEQGEGRRSCQMVASPAGGSARVAGTGGDTMETFRLAAHMRQGRTERSLSLPAAGGICCCRGLCSQLPVWKCFFPLTSTHQPRGFRCRFPNIWRIHQGHKGCYI